MWTELGITPDENHQKPATLATAVDASPIEAPAIKAPTIGGNCYAMDRDGHQQDLMHAGAGGFNPDAAALSLSRESYAMNVQMAQEVQCEVGHSEPVVEAIDADVGQVYQERMRVDHAAAEISAGNGEGAAPSASPEAAEEGQKQAAAGRREEKQASAEHRGEPETHLVERRGNGEKNMMQSLDELLAKFGIGQRRFDCADCGAKQVSAPAEEITNPSHAAAKKHADRDFDPTFFARKQQNA